MLRVVLLLDFDFEVPSPIEGFTLLSALLLLLFLLEFTRLGELVIDFDLVLDLVFLFFFFTCLGEDITILLVSSLFSPECISLSSSILAVVSNGSGL